MGRRAKVSLDAAVLRGDAALQLAIGVRMKSILDPTFHYVPSAQTDLRKTFSRVRRELAKAKSQSAREIGAPGRVLVLSRAPREIASR